ncbi:MAG: ABC transporter permease [Chitinophagaceae bacterium]|nr:ABC transporter permease [Chitinophagaceae bacterium]MCB9046393.1 ABC transporter permease [Chitinophagales bacterium]
MLKLFAIEWLKVRKYRTFWIMIGMFVLLLPLWNYGINQGVLKMGGKGKDGINLLDQAYNFGHVWENMGWWTSVFVMFITILTIIIITNEYSFRTQRQNIIDGWTRMDSYHAKWLMVLIFAIFTTLYTFIVGFVFGISGDSMSNFPGNIEKLFYVFVLSLNYYGFGLLIAYLFKRSGIAIGIFFLYNMIIEKLLQSLINWKMDYNAGDLLPLQASDELLPFPLMSVAKQMMQMKNEIPPSVYLLASFAWIVIYYLIAWFRLLRSDW